jgi:inorganic pyrophosphatase
VRNDRLIGVSTEFRRQNGIRKLRDMPDDLLAEIQHLFSAYNEIKGKKIKVLGCHGPRRANGLVKAGIKRSKEKK